MNVLHFGFEYVEVLNYLCYLLLLFTSWVPEKFVSIC